MPTLAPRTDFQVAIENPVQKPSALQALSGLFDAGLSVVGKIQKADPNLEQGLINGLDHANQLREQGDEKGALAMERTVLTNYSIAGGDTSSSETQDLIRVYTGRAPESVGFTQEELLAQEIQDPDSEMGKRYGKALLGAKGLKPNGSPEEQHDLAISLMVKEQANDMLVQEAQFNWSDSSRTAILDKVSGFGSIALGAMANVAESGGTIGLQDVQAVRAQFNNFKAQIMATRPANLPASEWEPIAAALSAREEQIKYLETLAGPGNLDAVASTELMRAVQEAGIGNFNANIATRMIADDPTTFLDRGIGSNSNFNMDMASVVKYMDEPSGGGLSEGDIRDPSTWDEIAITGEDGQPLSPEDGLKYAQASSTVLSSIPSDRLATNPELRNEWGRAAVRQLSAIQGVTENGRFLSKTDVSKLFGNKWISDMNTLRTTDPALYNAVLSKTQRVLGAQLQVVGQKFSVVAEGTPFEFNKTSGEWRFNPTTAKRVMDANMVGALEDGVDRLYGGDWDALMADNGARFHAEGFSKASSAWGRVAGVRGAVPADIKAMGDVYSTLNATLQKMGTFEAAQTQTSSFQKNSKLINMVDATEGAGNYDTLFGHSQKADGAFAGTRITQMTIGELKKFTSVDGRYGQWVKGKVGRVATPMGRYQFVGTTMKAVASKMGLGDDVLFTPAVQDAMFHFHVNEILQDKPSDQWAGILRGTWEGFQKKDNAGEYVYSDQDLVNAAAEFLGTPPPAVAYETGRGDFASVLAPAASVPPVARDTVQIDTTSSQVQSTEVAELDDSTSETTVEKGDASRAVASENRAQVIAELMEKWGLSERDATRLYEKAKAGE